MKQTLNTPQSKTLIQVFFAWHVYSSLTAMWSGAGHEVCTIFIVPCSLCPISKHRKAWSREDLSPYLINRATCTWNGFASLTPDWLIWMLTSVASLKAKLVRLAYLGNGTRHIWACRTRVRLIVLLSAKWHSWSRSVYRTITGLFWSVAELTASE